MCAMAALSRSSRRRNDFTARFSGVSVVSAVTVSPESEWPARAALPQNGLCSNAAGANRRRDRARLVHGSGGGEAANLMRRLRQPRQCALNKAETFYR